MASYNDLPSRMASIILWPIVLIALVLSPTFSPGESSESLPEDLRYEIIKAIRRPGIKCSLDIRLNRKLSKGQLRTLALRLRDAESRKYPRMFIGYYLPGMTVGAGAWATTHFNPDLKVEILGLTIEEEPKQSPKSNDRPFAAVLGNQ